MNAHANRRLYWLQLFGSLITVLLFSMTTGCGAGDEADSKLESDYKDRIALDPDIEDMRPPIENVPETSTEPEDLDLPDPRPVTTPPSLDLESYAPPIARNRRPPIQPRQRIRMAPRMSPPPVTELPPDPVAFPDIEEGAAAMESFEHMEVESMESFDPGESSEFFTEGSAACEAEPGEDELMSDSFETNEAGQTRVEVFYATDRKSTAPIVHGDMWRNFQLPVFALAIALILGLWSISRRRLIPGVIAVVILAGGVMTGHSAMIHWQRVERLASNDDVSYTAELREIAPEEDPLDYGRCVVNIPPDHRVGIVDSPSLQRFEFVEDPDRHVILERVINTPRDKFFRDLNQRLANGSGDTVVFIHGYNVSFENAVKRTAQIAFDLKFAGVPICYSWPAHGGLEDYTRDMANADWTVTHLQHFLTSLFDETGAERIHLIAHSMGNRALMQALDRMALQWNQERNHALALASDPDSPDGTSIARLLRRSELPRFGQIIMAAPDISADEFRQRYAETLRKLSSQITLYASSRDRALMVSTSVHGHNRAGLAGEDICIVDGIDTIDVSHIDTSLIGHSYYGDNPALIDDLRALIQLAQTTSERQWLEQVKMASDKVYWKFR